MTSLCDATAATARLYARLILPGPEYALSEYLTAMGGELSSGGLQGMDHHFAHDGMKALT
jgi:hypothetical protein